MNVETKRSAALLAKAMNAFQKARISARLCAAVPSYKGTPPLPQRIVAFCSHKGRRSVVVAVGEDYRLHYAPSHRGVSAADMKRIVATIEAVNASVKPLDSEAAMKEARTSLVRQHFPDATIEKLAGDDFDVYFASGVRWTDVDIVADNEGNVSIVRYAILKKGSTVARVYERQVNPLDVCQALRDFKAKHRASYAKLVAVACKEAA